MRKRTFENLCDDFIGKVFVFLHFSILPFRVCINLLAQKFHFVRRPKKWKVI